LRRLSGESSNLVFLFTLQKIGVSYFRLSLEGFMSTRYLLACVLLLSVAACWGQQQPTFTPQTLPASCVDSGLVSGDFNRDGWPDLAVVDCNGVQEGLDIYLGIGNGNFNLANVYPGFSGGNFICGQLLTADMNGDGNLDLIFPSCTPGRDSSYNGIEIYYGDGKGNFPSSNFIFNSGGGQLGDLNGDGRIDIVDGGKVWLNKGNGNFTSVLSPYAGGLLIDVNGDGKLDSVSYGSKGLAVSKGLGTGKFAAPYYTGGKEPVLCIDAGHCNSGVNGFVFADFYNLGHLDLAILLGACDYNLEPADPCAEALYIYKNSGSGTFSLAHSYKFTSSTNGTQLYAADLNNDQKQDIVVYDGNLRGGEPLYFMGNGNGTFAPPSGAGLSWGWDSTFAFTRDLGLTSRQDVVSTRGYYSGQATEIDLNTTPVTNCQPPSSSILAAHICSPLAGASPKTIVVKGSGNSPAGVQRLEVWIDGVKKAQSLSDQISKTFTLAAGSHRVALVAVDKYKGTAKSTVYITVP
jgi:hypothetical protein